MFRSSILVAAFAVIGGAVSFLNQMVLALHFGASAELDAYLLAISLPLSTTALFVGVIGYQIVPTLQQQKTREGNDDFLISSLVWGLGGIALFFSVTCCAFARPLLRFLHPFLSPHQVELAVTITRLAWLWMPLAVAGAIYSAALHIRQRFFAATAIQSAPILGSMLFCLVGAQKLGVSALAWGQLAGYAALVAVLRVALGPTKFSKRDWSGLRKVLINMPFSLGAIVIFIMYPVVDAYWGSRIGASAVSYLGYSQRLLVGISTILVTASTTVIFPRLAKLAAEGAHDAVRENLALSLRFMMVCMVPAAVVLSLLALPVLQLLFQRGAFLLKDAENIARLLPWMLVGMVAMSCTTLIFKAIFTQSNTSAAITISLFGALSYFLLAGLLSGPFGVIGMGISYALSWWLTFGAGVAYLWRGQLSRNTPAILRFGYKLCLATTLAGLFTLLGSNWLPPADLSASALRLVVVIGVTTGTALVYFALAQGPFALAEIRMLTAALAGFLLPAANRPTNRS